MALDFPNAPSPGEVFDSWQWDGTKWIPAPNPAWQTPIVFFFPGLPVAGFEITVPIALALNVPANFGGSEATYLTAPAVQAVFGVMQNGINVGTINVPTTGAVSFTTSGFSLAVGDVLAVQAPTPQDTALAGPSFTILATRV